MPALKRKAAVRAKRVTRAKSSKSAPRYSAPEIKIPVQIDLLKAAHRGLLGAAVAETAVDQLRTVSQVVGLTHDAARRRGEVAPAVAKAMARADAILTAQIAELERLADVATSGPLDVGELLARTVALTRRRFGVGVKLSVDVPLQLPAANASATDVTESLFALLMNSFEVLHKKGGRIHLSAGHDSKFVRVVVQDDGPGLPPVVKRRLFQPFVRGRTGASHFGIGLAVARELALRNGGDLSYEPRSARGARFVLVIPRWNSARSGRRAAAS